ncbi:MAG: beta-lactamase family protein [Blastocatellia bacterium]|nr:beta-lactamase family protein [Blastocatellia bacterium]
MKFAVILLLFASVAMHAQPDKISQFQDTFRRELTDAGVVGGSFVMVRDGKTLAEVHHGLANIESDQRVTADTIYHWASNTKPFTGIAIMQFRDRGLIKLDDPVTKYLPELRKIHNPFGSTRSLSAICSLILAASATAHGRNTPPSSSLHPTPRPIHYPTPPKHQKSILADS